VWAASRKLVDEIAAAVEGALEITLTPSSVSALAVRSEISDAALAPTAALTGLSGKEARDVEA
jgi:recombination associated protein RdgC